MSYLHRITNQITCKRFFYTSVLMLFAFAKAYSQDNSSNTRATTFTAGNLHTLMIELNEYAEIHLQASQTTNISITTTQRGEYKEAVELTHYIKNDTVFFKDPISNIYQKPDDKLAAHKVTDAVVKMVIPHDMNLNIVAQSASIHTRGSFSYIQINCTSGAITIEDPNCDLDITNILGSTTIYCDSISPEIRLGKKATFKDKRRKKRPNKNGGVIQTSSGNISILNTEDK